MGRGRKGRSRRPNRKMAVRDWRHSRNQKRLVLHTALWDPIRGYIGPRMVATELSRVAESRPY
jgi:hypothetical protein